MTMWEGVGTIRTAKNQTDRPVFKVKVREIFAGDGAKQPSFERGTTG